MLFAVNGVIEKNRMNIQLINKKGTEKKLPRIHDCKLPTIHDCKLINLPNFKDERGRLVAIEGGKDIPFTLKRVFFVSELGVQASRGAHAHKTLSEVIICLTGSLQVSLDDGKNSKTLLLDDKSKGLYLPPMIWATENKFTASTVYLVLASDNYKPSDYIRDYTKFETIRNSI